MTPCCPLVVVGLKSFIPFADVRRKKRGSQEVNCLRRRVGVGVGRSNFFKRNVDYLISFVYNNYNVYDKSLYEKKNNFLTITYD